MKCSPIPQLSYGQFSFNIHEKAAESRIPLGGGLEPTHRCNLKCVHCYARCRSMKQERRSELSFREISGILDQIAEEGCLWLLITGGEPLIREDFLDIYMYAKKKGFIVTIFTNGTLVSKEVIDCFRKWRPFNIEVTLYGATSETYETVTQVPGSFAKCLKGIDLLLDAGLPLQLKSIIMTLNRHEVGQLKEFSESRGMPFLIDPILSPRLDRSRDPCSFRLSPREVVEIDVADPERVQQWKEYLADFRGRPKSNHLYLCGAGQTSFFINPYGELQMCVLSRSPSYDLRRGSFRGGWYEFLGKVRQRKARDDFPCKECDLISLCGQCPGWSYLEHGNEDSRVDYLCQIAHLREQAFCESNSIETEKGGDVA